MFFEIDRNQNSSIVLDIKTKKIFEISTYLRKKRTDIHEKEFLHIGLMQNGTNYSLFVDNFSINVYKGTFLNMFDNIILFNHNIRVKNVLYVHGGILIQVRCNCWGKFEIEVPMYMEQTIFLDTTKGVLNKGTLVALTYTPFMIYTNKDCTKMMALVDRFPLMNCFVDFNDLTYCKKTNTLNFYGYNIKPQRFKTLKTPINILDNMRNCFIC